MAEPASDVVAPEDAPKAPKDKSCPYCGQAFTSSSLGRHLDLYIKERNPKRPDGIHNVDEIRKLRGNVTRRQPKGPSSRRHTSTPAGTPLAFSKKGSVSDIGSPAARSPSATGGKDGASPPKSGSNGLAQMYALRWEATGVMNEIPARSPEDGNGGDDGVGLDEARSNGDAESQSAGHDAGRRIAPSRAVSRQIVKAHLDMKQKMQDALDSARAAELALKEFMGSWRAAKQQIDVGSMPFDFDPLAMNFPALTLHCLRSTPTLFATTQHPMPSSWSTTPPGASQYEALKTFFKDEFRKWRAACAIATTAVYEELQYPPTVDFQHKNGREAVEQAERTAEKLERECGEHLETAFAAWDVLPPERQNELWVLELARGVATRQGEVNKLRESQHSLQQEVTNLKSQIEQLNRLQQPREFKIMPPATFPVSKDIVAYLQDAAVSRGRQSVGMSVSDRHTDLNTVVSAAIGRWKSVIVSSRAASSGMSAQRPLGSAASQSPTTSAPPHSGTLGPASGSTGPPVPSIGSPKQARAMHQAPPRPGVAAPPPPTPIAPTAPMEATQLSQPKIERTQHQQQQAQQPEAENASGSEDDEMSDKDADAEMEDGDEFAHMHTPMSHALPAGVAPTPLTMPLPQQTAQQLMPQLKVARIRGAAQHSLSALGGVPNGLGTGGQITSSRSMPEINGGMHMHVVGNNMMHQADIGLAMPTFGRDSMYMD